MFPTYNDKRNLTIKQITLYNCAKEKQIMEPRTKPNQSLLIISVICQVLEVEYL